MNKLPVVRSLLTAAAIILAPGPATAELQPDTMMVVETLPVPYPEDWVFVMDGSFFHFAEGKMILLDPTAETQPEQYKGMVNGSMIAPMLEAGRRSEIYVADIHMSRWPNGERKDTLTVYDKKTLAPLAAID
ncbi:MAG: hypothetical protein KJO38_11895, partial [Gammaproteobacteria bacterium]|nr:hypothetical protein [Gammaproteobacteria bacterium]